ncbi:protein of unknown function [Prosthecobacter debontii]|uniref:3-keto-alpha-glucoside-1,2-lyase/3-keto-2-hydroxy-glucal hydratase domain-containing protein n=1 Tax=Prosthecobacter debontii TaxID=48467 RepID=A0A1T4XXX6_9BACT|nr:DUF1080 domain-containing protein [Prosthecobacter debontii]SKA94374.1 protein of unknown function [Prosthecobacter debontii]
MSFPQLLSSCFAVAALGLSPLLADAPNQLSAEEKAQGFQLLFDGQSFTGWEHKGNWVIQDGALDCPKRGGDITYTVAKVPDDFELRFEWKASKGCNSGVYYRPGQYEYQVLDNANSDYGKNPRSTAASLYFCMAPSRDNARPHDVWNEGRIVCKGTVIQHWLNGEAVVDFDYTDPRWAREIEVLRIRGGDLNKRGAFLRLQDHGQPVAYRSLRLRTIPAGEKLVPSPEFKPQPMTPEALEIEAKRIEQLLHPKPAKKKKAS